MPTHPIAALGPQWLLVAGLCVAAWSTVSFVSVSTGYTEGDVLSDAASPIQDFEVEFNDVIAGYARSLAVGSRLGSFAIVVPYVTGEATGLVNGVPRKAPRSGLGDLRVRFTLHLLEGSALDPASFPRAAPDRTLGLGLVLAAPTGEYDNVSLAWQYLWFD